LKYHNSGFLYPNEHNVHISRAEIHLAVFNRIQVHLQFMSVESMTVDLHTILWQKEERCFIIKKAIRFALSLSKVPFVELSLQRLATSRWSACQRLCRSCECSVVTPVLINITLLTDGLLIWPVGHGRYFKDLGRQSRIIDEKWTALTLMCRWDVEDDVRGEIRVR